MEPPKRPGPRMESLPSIEGRCNSKHFIWQHHGIPLIVPRLLERKTYRRAPRVTGRNMRRLGNFPVGSLIVAYGVMLLFGSCTVSHPTYVAKPSEPSPTPMPAPVPRPTRAAELRGVWVSDTTKLDWDSATANL